jgi:hypothetical protein
VAEVFGEVLGGRPHHKDRQRDDVQVSRQDLLDVRVPGGSDFPEFLTIQAYQRLD